MLFFVIQGPVSKEYQRNLENLVMTIDFVKTKAVWCYTVGDNEQDWIRPIGITNLPVPDCGPIAVKKLPHFANTNRMFLTTKSAFAKTPPEASHVLKLRSDLAVYDKIKFRTFISELLCSSSESIYCVSQSNHDWDLPFNFADWCYGGVAPELQDKIENLFLLPRDSGYSDVRHFSDYVFGYVKRDFSPQYTTEQVFGSLLFSQNLNNINCYSGFVTWQNIKKINLKILNLQEVGLKSVKHKTISVPKRKPKNLLSYAFFTLLKNIIRSMC